jgi:hypothetical protein
MLTAIATDLAPLPDERFDIDFQDDKRGTALVNPRRLPLPQQTALVDYLERITTALESTVPFNPMAVQQWRPSGKDLVPGLGSEDRKHLRNMEGDIAEMKAELVQIKELLSADCGEVASTGPGRRAVGRPTRSQRMSNCRGEFSFSSPPIALRHCSGIAP